MREAPLPNFTIDEVIAMRDAELITTNEARYLLETQCGVPIAWSPVEAPPKTNPKTRKNRNKEAV